MSNIWSPRVAPKSLSSSAPPRVNMPHVDATISNLSVRQKRVQGQAWVDRFRSEDWSPTVAQELANTTIRERKAPSSSPSIDSSFDDISSIDEQQQQQIELAPTQRALRYYSDREERERFLTARPLDPLMRHQETGIEFSLQRELDPDIRGGFHLDVTRMGKSLMLLDFILRDLQNRIRAGELRFGKPTLILAPKMALLTLARQLTKHYGTNPPLIVIFVRSPSHMRAWTKQNLVSACDVVVTSYSVVQACHANPTIANLPFSIEWTRIICDEAHKLSNEKTGVFQAVMDIKAGAHWYVSATLIQNSINDLRSALRFVRMESAKIKELLRDIKSDAFRETMRPLFIRRTPADVTDAYIPRVESVGVTDMNLDFYDQAEYDLYRHIYSMTRTRLKEERKYESKHHHDSRRRANIRELIILLKLRQMCVAWPIVNGLKEEDLPKGMRFPSIARDGKERTDAYMRHALYLPPKDPRAEEVRSLGVNVLPLVSTKERKFIKNLYKRVIPAGDKIVLFCSWVEPLKRLYDLLQERAKIIGAPHSGVCIITGVDSLDRRDVIVDTLRSDPNIRCLLITFGSGEVSLDLSAANHNIVYDIWWNPAREDQAFDRIGGRGQTKQLYASRMIMHETIEEEIRRICERKQAIADQVYDTHNDLSLPELGGTAVGQHADGEDVARALIDWMMEN